MRVITRTAIATLAGAALITTAAACSSSGGSSGSDSGSSAPAGASDTPSASASPSPVADLTSLDKGISTSVKLDAGFVSALTSLKVTPGTVGKATLANGSVSFPITGGHVTLYKKGDVTPYVQGEIDHVGSGLSLTAGGIKVELTNFVVDPGNNSKVTGTVTANGKKVGDGIKLFTLDGTTLQTPSIDSSTGVATLTGTRVLLSPDAAALLNKTYKITALKGGTNGTLVGIATIKVGTK